MAHLLVEGFGHSFPFQNCINCCIRASIYTWNFWKDAKETGNSVCLWQGRLGNLVVRETFQFECFPG